MMRKRLLLPIFLVFILACPGAQENSISAQSVLNWNVQNIQSVISLDTKKRGIQLPTGRNAALQMLEMETPTLLKDSYFSIIVNSSEKLGNSVERGDISLSDLNRILDQGKKTPPYFSFDLKEISMSHTVSLTQIGSLFIKHQNAFIPKTPLETVPSREFTGILIDARGNLDVHGEYVQSPLVPCLFPRIWSADMETVYEKNMVNSSIAKQKGIVLYTASLDEKLYRDRIGTDPLRLTARKIFGENRTDPVIAVADYLKIMSVPENKELLRQGNVVIICNADELVPQKAAPVKDENYYFIRKDIQEKLELQGVKRIDFSDSWEGLKLTIYDIRFKADSAEILGEEQGRLDGIADALALAGPLARFIVEGHTASIGKPAGELTLSIQRAERIAGELDKRGISRSRSEFTGYGGTRPVASNETDEGRSKNRRVEITIRLD